MNRSSHSSVVAPPIDELVTHLVVEVLGGGSGFSEFGAGFTPKVALFRIVKARMTSLGRGVAGGEPTWGMPGRSILGSVVVCSDQIRTIVGPVVAKQDKVSQ